MIVTINAFSPHKTALTMAIVMALVSLILIIPIMLFGASLPATLPDGSPIQGGLTTGFLLLAPVMYFVLTYIAGLIGCLVYNQVAKLTGGFQLRLSQRE